VTSCLIDGRCRPLHKALQLRPIFLIPGPTQFGKLGHLTPQLRIYFDSYLLDQFDKKFIVGLAFIDKKMFLVIVNFGRFNKFSFVQQLSNVVGLIIKNVVGTSRMGMVVDRDTGLQIGSIVEKNFVVTPGQFKNNAVRIRLRNTSGTPNFGLRPFKEKIQNSLSESGYSVAAGDGYGILLDVNVMYVGQISKNLSREFAFLGGATGILAANSSSRKNMAAGLAGATLGAVAGSYVTEDTYIVVSEVTVAVIDSKRGRKTKKITFGVSKKKKKEEEKDFHSFSRRESTKIAVFVGGRNLGAEQIRELVSERFANIIGNII